MENPYKTYTGSRNEATRVPGKEHEEREENARSRCTTSGLFEGNAPDRRVEHGLLENPKRTGA